MKARSMALALSLSLLAGCASRPQLPPVRGGAPISLTVVTSAPTDTHAAVRDTTVGESVSTGAGAGAVAGALWGLSCGPLFLLCAPLGALMVSGVGVIAGGAVGLATSLPQETATRLHERLTQLQQTHDPLEELRNNLSDRARKHWTLSAEPPSTAINVELQNLFLTSTREQRVGLVMQVRVSVRPAGARADAAPTQKAYEHVGPSSSLAVWLDEQSDFAQTSLRSASQQIALQIIADLAPN